MRATYLIFIIFAVHTVTADIATMYNGCGETKTCFGFPGGCVNTQDCIVLATAIRWSIPWVSYGMEFELYSRSNSSFVQTVEPAYVALGFSFDNKIGADLVNEYVAPFPYNPLQVFKSISIGNTTVREEGPNYDIQIQEASADGPIYVKYQTSYSMSTSGITYSFEDELYLILLAGSQVKEDTIGVANLLSPQISEKPVVLTKESVILN